MSEKGLCEYGNSHIGGPCVHCERNELYEDNTRLRGDNTRLRWENTRLRKAGSKLENALSRIDYLCGEPNEMEVSGYSVHYDEEAVVKSVEHLRSVAGSAIESAFDLREDNNRLREENSRLQIHCDEAYSQLNKCERKYAAIADTVCCDTSKLMHETAGAIHAVDTCTVGELFDENTRLQELAGLLEDHGPEGHNVTNLQYHQLLAENQKLLEELQEADKYRLTEKEWEDKYG